MGLDVLALQYLYGARAARTTDDTYRFGRADADQFTVGSQISLSPSTGVKQVLWDAGGYNTLDFSGITSGSGYRIDTRPLGWITTGGNFQGGYYVAGVTVGPGVRIHRVVNSPSDDTIYANADANTISGYAPGKATGRDVIIDASSADVIDLSAFTDEQVTETPDGSDLVVALPDGGTITVRNYYAGNRPTIAVGGGSPPPPAPAISLTVGDTRLAEGNSGYVWHWFSVRLSAAAAEAVTVSYATADGTALAGSDYVPGSGRLTFAPGETAKYVAVAAAGDTTVEPDETFVLRLTNPGGGVSLADGEAVATIVNDDAPPVTVLVASASASPTSGTAPLNVTFSSAASTLPPDGAVS
jgi:serralysin